MSIGEDYVACPHCAVENMTFRKFCWRCGATLPYTIGPSGRVQTNGVQSASVSEIAALLAQAETLDLQAAREPVETAQPMISQPAPRVSSVWSWLRRASSRTPAS